MTSRAQSFKDHRLESSDVPVALIQPTKGWVSLQLGELWRFKELLYFLTWRDVKVRYKQTLLGGAWAVIQPVLMMIVFSVFFGGLAGVSSNGVPYPLFAYVALVPWTFFANGVGQSSNSLVGNSNLITKVYFPRLIIPIASIMSGIVDFLVAFVLIIVMMAYYGIAPSVEIAALPLFMLLALIAALGVGLWLSALNVQYRDVRYVVPFITQFWLFVTPIAYPSSLLEEPWRTVYGINPMAGVVEGFRWALLGMKEVPASLMLVSFASALVMLATGAVFFRRMERTFADVV